MQRLILTSAAALALAGAGTDMRSTMGTRDVAGTSERSQLRNRLCPVTGRRADPDLPLVPIATAAGGHALVAVANPEAALRIAAAPPVLQALYAKAAARGEMVRDGRIVTPAARAETDRITRHG